MGRVITHGMAEGSLSELPTEMEASVPSFPELSEWSEKFAVCEILLFPLPPRALSSFMQLKKIFLMLCSA